MFAFYTWLSFILTWLSQPTSQPVGDLGINQFSSSFCLAAVNLFPTFHYMVASTHISRSIHAYTLSTRLVLLDLPFHNFRATKNPWIDEFYVVKKRRATDFKAPKLGKGLSGAATDRSLKAAVSWKSKALRTPQLTTACDVVVAVQTQITFAG